MQLSFFGEVVVAESTGATKCPKCGQLHDNGGGGKTSYCKPCKSEYNRVMTKLRQETKTPDLDYVCPICQRSGHEIHVYSHVRTPWRLDHDHVTGEFRAYLCDSCNVGLGKFNDDPDMLKRAIAYLHNGNS